jgi:hypothetical protein
MLQTRYTDEEVEGESVEQPALPHQRERRTVGERKDFVLVADKDFPSESADLGVDLTSSMISLATTSSWRTTAILKPRRRRRRV